MKFFFVKSSKSSHVLNEKEIQERLYGHYRSGTFSTAAENVQVGSGVPKLTIPRPEQSGVLAEWFQILWRTIGITVKTLSGRFSLKFAAVVGSVLILSIVFLQVVSRWFGGAEDRREEISQAASVSLPEVSTKQEAIAARPSRNSSSDSGGAIQATAIGEESAVSLENSELSGSAEVRKRKFYAVQVCTYQKEADAGRLVEKLKATHFEPFYRRVMSPRQRIPYYVVFAGQHETFSGAQALLGKFKDSELFGDFSDSFILSL